MAKNSGPCAHTVSRKGEAASLLGPRGQSTGWGSCSLKAGGGCQEPPFHMEPLP